MKVAKEILVCITPFMVSAIMLYPFVAIIGGSTDPFTWERADRLFYFIWTVCFGYALFYRVQCARKEGV
jgi:hypothetical protein